MTALGMFGDAATAPYQNGLAQVANCADTLSVEASTLTGLRPELSTFWASRMVHTSRRGCARRQLNWSYSNADLDS